MTQNSDRKRVPLIEGLSDSVPITFAELKSRPSFDDITMEESPHYHLQEYFKDKLIEDILYRSFQPAQWALHDIIMIWRNNNYKVAEYDDYFVDNGQKHKIKYYEVQSFGDIILRKVQIKQCTCDCFSLFKFEEWLNGKKDYNNL